MTVPKYHDLFNPLLAAMRRLGDSASIHELDEEVISALDLKPAEISQLHGDRGAKTELEYRLAWARTYLKAYGLVDNSARGVWSLTPKGVETHDVDPRKVVQHVHEARKGRGYSRRGSKMQSDNLPTERPSLETWRETLQTSILGLEPAAFERLCQRLLRESGFVHVEVTGRSGDGGIDGVGIVRLGGLLGFPIMFQCKRYAGAVPPSAIRDFRGAVIGRADRGLMITTGTYSRDARREATRDGALPIDLIDGDELLDKLKELRLGVTVEMIESVAVVPDWFDSL